MKTQRLSTPGNDLRTPKVTMDNNHRRMLRLYSRRILIREKCPWTSVTECLLEDFDYGGTTEHAQ